MWSGNAVEVESVPAPAEPLAAPATEAEQPAALPEPAQAPAPVVTADGQPTPAPPKRTLKPRTVASAQPSTAASASEPSSESAGSTSVASFGSVGLPPGVRHLPSAFARALPEASYGDAGWEDLPLGGAGEFTLELTVDDEGKLGELVYTDPKQRDRLAAPLRHMVERAMILLKSGTFSIAQSTRESGRQRFKLSVEISQEAPPDEGVPFNKAYDSPRPGHPGNARILLRSGRRIYTRIWLVP